MLSSKYLSIFHIHPTSPLVISIYFENSFELLDTHLKGQKFEDDEAIVDAVQELLGVTQTKPAESAHTKKVPRSAGHWTGGRGPPPPLLELFLMSVQEKIGTRKSADEEEPGEVFH
ncbi:hypothetical protein EVAR_43762_1 [Eumeta japonica]|uniref:Uncharacterized protein n=1 Tax=Eumeta variegata TaxID=151549 RepID=A0A4C1XKH1_EUMVA|nr:hypothetical protein EVAR_43762_1 [Eumeta japonica]